MPLDDSIFFTGCHLIRCDANSRRREVTCSSWRREHPLSDGARRHLTALLMSGGSAEGAATSPGDHQHPFPGRCDVCAVIACDTL